MITALLRMTGRALLRLRYRIKVTGIDAIAGKGRSGILFLPNHPALIDPIIIVTEMNAAFAPQALADKDQIDWPVVRWIARQVGARPIPDPARYGEACREEVEKVLADGIQMMKAGGNLLFWPAGRICHQRYEDLGGNSAVETVLKEAPDARVVVIRTRGLWGSSFSRAAGRRPNFGGALLQGLKYLLLNGILFGPRRNVSIELVELADVPRADGRAVLNRYLEHFYNEDAPPNTYVPHTIWERGGTRVLPEPQSSGIEGDVSEVSTATKEIVIGRLKEISGVGTIRETDSLARDLGMDSLSRVEVQTWLEGEFGLPVGDPESLQTVSDVLLAACGMAVKGSQSALKPIPSNWFVNASETGSVFVPDGTTITEVFLKQAKRSISKAAVADQTSGVRTYRDMITAIMVLKPIFQKLDGQYIGIMLPASGGAAVLYLSALFAGKIPVMVNWTVGSRNMTHSLDLLGVRHVLTAGQLVSRIESQGVNLEEIRDKLVLLEDIGKRISLVSKLAAWVRSRISWASLEKQPASDIAVVLFTSGSESYPKAVPLTHTNILSNVRDTISIFRLSPNERIIGILPPFHSFGLTCTLVLPICSAISTVYHPNPTEGSMLARLIDAYRVTMLIGTPTFLNGIVRAAEDPQLMTLKRVISGAEKCPAQLFETITRRWPGMMVLEGYGITECSPVVSVNREEKHRLASIGQVLPSVHYVIKDLDTGQKAAIGKPGMLLVRGPSIFGGYLHYDGPLPFEEFEGKQWYRTGDLVVESSDGMLSFSGRLKRFVKLGGEMVSLPAVEEALAKRYVRDDDNEPVLAVESTPSESNPELVLFTVRDIIREEANSTIREAGLSPIHNIRMVKNIDKIPTLGTGKTDYRALKGMLSQ